MGELFTPGEGVARRAQKRQDEAIGKQRQREAAGLADEEDELARRRALTKAGGRRSLIRTSELGTGKRDTLG